MTKNVQLYLSIDGSVEPRSFFRDENSIFYIEQTTPSERERVRDRKREKERERESR